MKVLGLSGTNPGDMEGKRSEDDEPLKPWGALDIQLRLSLGSAMHGQTLSGAILEPPPSTLDHSPRSASTKWFPSSNPPKHSVVLFQNS
jgi:hypothetical protein